MSEVTRILSAIEKSHSTLHPVRRGGWLKAACRGRGMGPAEGHDWELRHCPSCCGATGVCESSLNPARRRGGLTTKNDIPRGPTPTYWITAAKPPNTVKRKTDILFSRCVCVFAN